MKQITKTEETILLAIWRLKDKAYGVTIKKQIFEVTQREYLYSTLYTTLEQLVRKGYIEKIFGKPSPIRGGKRKIFFKTTDIGVGVLKAAFSQQRAVWEGITDNSFDVR